MDFRRVLFRSEDLQDFDGFRRLDVRPKGDSQPPNLVSHPRGVALKTRAIEKKGR